MRKLNPRRLGNPLAILLTVVIMVAGATLGVVIGQLLMLHATMGTVMVLGPLAALAAIPMAIAQWVLISSGLLMIVPVWAFLGGALFASGPKAVSQRDLMVEWFPETHAVHRRVNELAKALALPSIKWVGWFPDDGINAFARGLSREGAVIAFSAGAVERLTREQMDAVMAHELAHVANADMARMTYAHGVQDSLTWFLLFRRLKLFARWVFTPLSQLELMRFSRQREFWADAIAGALVGKQHMIGALAKTNQAPPKRVKPSMARFMFHQSLSGLFSTHPPTETRIKALMEERYIARLPYRAAKAKPVKKTASTKPVITSAAEQAEPGTGSSDQSPYPPAVANGLVSFGS